MTETIITNAALVLDNEILSGTLVIEDNLIKQIDSGLCQHPAAIDWQSDYLIPGLIELHTDNMEKYFKPRPGVIWPKLSAMLAHDTQMISSGVTTVFDAVAIGYGDIDSSRADIHQQIIDSIHYITEHQLSRAEHFLHLRCELSHQSTSTQFKQYASNSRLKLVSLMDHAPGQRQFADIDKYREYYQKKHGFNEAEMNAYIDRHQKASKSWAAQHRKEIAESCRHAEVPLASHDDATLSHVEEAISHHVSIAEFPTTLEAAERSHQKDLKVLMGAPNLIRGHSHSGNVAARELAEKGCLDILSSDYYPSSLLDSAFKLADLNLGYDLPKAISCVTRNPASSVGLNDRGKIEEGLLADVLRVSKNRDLPILKESWKSGARVG